jgi:hypothetical protein
MVVKNHPQTTIINTGDQDHLTESLKLVELALVPSPDFDPK